MVHLSMLAKQKLINLLVNVGVTRSHGWHGHCLGNFGSIPMQLGYQYWHMSKILPNVRACFWSLLPGIHRSGLNKPLIEVESSILPQIICTIYIKIITFLLYMILIYIYIYIYIIYWYSLHVFNGKDILPNSFNRLSKIWLKDSHHNETTGHDGESIQLLPCLFQPLWRL